MKNDLILKIENRNAVIGIIGLGYVGLPLAARYVDEGFKVIGFDVDEDKILKLNQGKSYIEHIEDDVIKRMIANHFYSSIDFSNAAKCDALIICVPTPLNKYREPDISFIIKTMDYLLPHLKKGQILSLESTTYPGTTDEELKPRLESKGFILGEDYFLVYSPEREDPGNRKFSTKTIPKICGGFSENCLEVGLSLYKKVIEKVVAVSSTRAAEMTKLLENIHRAVNIGLVNEMKIVADRMGINIHEVIDAAATKPFGFTPYYPGPGLGGHCIPIDPFYLTWKAREYGINTKFIELAGEINCSMPDYVMLKVSDGLNRCEKSIKNAKILVLGLAYKKNVDDLRESPSLHIMEKLRAQGARVSYSDPHIPSFPKMKEHCFELESVSVNSENLTQYDCVIIATDHDKFDFKLILEQSKLIIDTRGVFKYHKNSKIIKA